MASSSSAFKVATSRRKADIWNDFVELEMENRKYGQCNRCKTVLVASSNSTLRRHLEACKKKDIPEDTETETGTIPSDNQAWMFEQMRARMEGMQMVIREGLPFNLLERPNVVNWIRNCLQPQWEKVSRITLKRDAIKNWNQIKHDMIAFFDNYSGRVALTCDMWSSPHNLSDTYICITCHHVDHESWQMVKRTITFENLPHPHSGERIYQVISSTINDFKIKNKIMTISFDNATNNDNAILRLKEDLNGPCNNLFLHGRCVCHILNLVVGVALEKFKNILDKFRRMNTFIFRNGKKMAQAYHAYCKERGVRRLKGEMDMPVRWNSTYKMLKRLLKQKEVLTGFYDMYNKSNEVIYESDWKIIVDLVDLLEVFYIASTKLSGVYYPTSPMVLDQIVLICKKLGEYRGNEEYASIIVAMIQKLMKYFKLFPPIFTISACLNPIINKTNVTNWLELIEDYVTTEFFSSEENINLFEESLEGLFRFYKNINTTRTTQSHNVGGSSRSTGKSFLGLLNKQSSKRAKTGSSTNPVDELSMYCSSMFTINVDANESFNILEWWQNRKNDYPVLAVMARDILTVQASTVASESCFSTSGRLISERRTRLTPESVELCICLKDYLDSVDRVQNNTSLEEFALDGLEEDLASGSEQTSYTSGTDDQSYNMGSNEYFPQMTPDMFQSYQPNQPQEAHFSPIPQQLFQPHQDFQPFHHFIQPPNQLPSFYNTEDQNQTQQFQTPQQFQGNQGGSFNPFQLRDINEDADNEDDDE